MATTSASFIPRSSTDAEFRAWCSFVNSVFTLGWTQTADTGQINLTTVAKPAATNTKQGYEIWEMADTLQATVPCFVRIDYGSSQYNLQQPGIWVTVGTGSDGAGTITGIVSNGGAVTQATINPASTITTAQTSYGSADTNRITFSLGGGTATGYAIGLGIERTKDSAGADSSEGVIIAYQSDNCFRPSGLTGGAASVSAEAMHYAVWSGTQPPFQRGWEYVLSPENPTVFGSDVGIGICIPLATVAKQPGNNFAMCRSSDFIVGATPTMSLYGATRTFVCLACTNLYRGAASDTTARILMRYD